MITGFNTDIDHEGTTYHVQTEDKGLETPFILSLVYVGGAILASKRTPYEDLLAKGFDEKVLIERLQRQHKLICAAIRAGRIEDLKRMGEGAEEAQPSKWKPDKKKRRAETVAEAKSKAEEEITEVVAQQSSTEAQEAASEVVAAETQTSSNILLDLVTDWHVPIVPEIVTPSAVDAQDELEEVYSGEVYEHTQQLQEGAAALDGVEEEIYLSLLDDEGDFRAGQLATIKIYVGRGKYGRRALPNAKVLVKVLGTSFRPLILSTQTDEEGLALVRALLPQFTSGRAAILIRATDEGGETAELRRIIHR